MTGWKGYAAATLAGAVVAGSMAWTAQGWRYSAQIAGIERDQAQAVAQAEQAARDEERRRIQEVEHVRTQAQSEIDEARTAAARADDTAGRLRNELARIRKAASAAAAAHGGQGQPGADPIDMLAGLLERLERDGRAIAGYADELRVAGLACEASYDAARR